MARPKSKEPKQQYTVMLKPSIVKDIDRIADKLEISRSQLMANLIDSGLDDARILDKLGVLAIIKAGGKLNAKLKRDYLKKEPEAD